MAIFHFTVKIVGRSKGKSVISASAYLNGDVMKNEETGRISYYSFDVIGASPEECYGYAGPVGKSGSETANDGESWWEKRHERMEELMKERSS